MGNHSLVKLLSAFGPWKEAKETINNPANSWLGCEGHGLRKRTR